VEPDPIGVMGFFGRPRYSRQDKIRREVAKSRQSPIPTWALVALLVAVIVAWGAIIVLP
jgi:hypothetical protein